MERDAQATRARGIAYAAAAYLTWGVFPLYFRALGRAPAVEVLAHRIVWSAVFMVALVTAARRWRAVRAQLRGRATLVGLAASATCISANWLVYIWAVNHDHVLDASLGYFINPLVTVLLGVAFLREPLSRRQLVAVALAGAGVVAMVAKAGTVPWVALVLAATFGMYGLVRKRVPVDAATGLLGEVALLAPAALLYFAWAARSGSLRFGSAAGESLLLASTGIATSVPLLWFAAAVRRLRLSTVGLLQYLNPTMQLGLAVLVLRERFTSAHALAFGCIWAGLALYASEALTATRRLERRAVPAEPPLAER